jgi:hypothetical protein
METRNTEFEFEIGQLVIDTNHILKINVVGEILRRFQRCPYKRNEQHMYVGAVINAPWYEVQYVHDDELHMIPEEDLEVY